MAKHTIGGLSSEGLPYSRAVRAGDFIYVSGMLGFGPDGAIVSGGVAAETRQILGDLQDLLAEAGCGLGDVVKVNVCLPNAEDFDAFNAAYAEFFASEPPARATICAGLTIDARIEIEAIVYDPQPRREA
ncbi:MAG: RidA family protein [Sphingomonadales bacterium]|nr:RidA family protein [Sphingomonadales bacterium]